jgi:hypothetical protein
LRNDIFADKRPRFDFYKKILKENCLVAIFGWAYALWSLVAFASFLINGKEHLPELSAIFPFSIDDKSTSEGDFSSKLLKNALLFGFWGFHHSLMCRRTVKKLMNLPKVFLSSRLSFLSIFRIWKYRFMLCNLLLYFISLWQTGNRFQTKYSKFLTFCKLLFLSVKKIFFSSLEFFRLSFWIPLFS